ncbi:PEP-CTERM sorting domain-containing protein [Pseudoduganella plicata]|uniref:PEP-CTERM sorting domain-containing protein n=1 Tax=Pseudoduganella plicata TaxID=321984 RepID=A0A4P7BFH5_9BURK|nr:PEP-CTERM sorting domain-containing protein [Pseudoduganella plicata]QBQ36315.1 PEP-CTERM sorting domain-containing protein [Pseudoduganella plicata]GGY76159.1 hypothetical protein GCM10007388_05980 [Pseudoduganella plicata]
MKPTKVVMMGVLSLAAMAPGLASADVRGTSSVGGFGIEITDLDPSDGIDAALTWWPMRYQYRPYNTVRMNVATQDGFWMDRVEEQLDAVGSPQALTLFEDGYTYAMTLTGRPALTTLRIDTAVTTEEDLSVLRSGDVSAGSDLYHFTLAPNTGVRFFGAMSSSAVIEGEAGFDQWYNAHANMTVLIRDANGGVEYFAFDEAYHNIVSLAGENRSLDETIPYEVSYLNGSGSSRDGYLSLHLDQHTGAALPWPVPEPSAFWMMGAGLALMGIRARARAWKPGRA